MPVSPERLSADLDRFAAIGAHGLGVTRLALSPADREARLLLIEILQVEGLEVRMDPFGNIFGRLGRWDRPAVLMGSHIDTVPNGGRFDGTLGVVGALEAIRALREDGRLPDCPVGVVAFSCEEAARFAVGTVGSKGFTGALPPEQIWALTDRSGVTYADALAANGGWEAVGGRPEDPGAVAAYLELHIEQGRVLEQRGLDIGVVTQIAAPTRLRLSLTGRAAHSGSTPMEDRQDALAAAAELILGLERIGRADAQFGTVTTATIFGIDPISINVIPGNVELAAEVRSGDGAKKRDAVERFLALAREITAARSISLAVTTLADEEPVALNPAMQEAIREACETVGASACNMISRAGHDAMYLATQVPTGMIFVPSQGGISHHPEEFTSLDALVLGTRVLVEAALKSAPLERKLEA